MGYTHYWRQRRQLTRQDWAELSQGVLEVVAKCRAASIALDFECDVPQRDPLVDREVIRFNGRGEEAGHETFYITRLRPELESWQKPADRGLGFCKTARKPYDLAVTAILAYLDSVLPEAFEVSSDGRGANWEAGVKLARECWPTKANMIDTPRAVKDKDRYETWEDGSKRFALAKGWDGRYYLEERATHYRIELPWDGDDYRLWVQSLPYERRRYGSFNGPSWRGKTCEHEACAERRLTGLWIAFAEHIEPPDVLTPLPA